MGTASITEFVQGDEVAARIYRHWDGYPDTAGTDIYRFFAEVESQTRDWRFSDAPYLAAKYVVYLASKFGQDGPGAPLDFLSVGVVGAGSYGEEYVYRVDCGELDTENRPTVVCHETDWDTGEVSGEPLDIPRPEIASNR